MAALSAGFVGTERVARHLDLCDIAAPRSSLDSAHESHLNTSGIPSAALVLVSDGRRARFLRNKGTAAHPELVLESTLECENASTVEETDWHQQAEERFAAQIANLLYQMEHAHKFDELVMVAPPKMLGDLRARLHREVADCVIAEVPKDLAGRPVPEIGRLLS